MRWFLTWLHDMQGLTPGASVIGCAALRHARWSLSGVRTLTTAITLSPNGGLGLTDGGRADFVDAEVIQAKLGKDLAALAHDRRATGWD